MRLEFVSSVFALLLVSVASAEDQPKSNIIAQRDHSFWLTVRDGALVLATQSANKEPVSHRRLSFNIPKDGRVTEMRLEPWVSNRGLCAVVEVSVGNEYQYLRVTLAIRPAGYSSASALFHTSTEDLSILAVNGTFRGDSVLALLGVIEIKDGIARVVSRGVVSLDDCPTPPTRGSISKFKAETEIDPALIKLLKNFK
jgi:hypothetical protein